MANILVIDDDPSIRRVLIDILSGEGHSVSLATHGKEGVSLLKDGEYDLLFTDLGLPGLSGWEIHQRRRRAPRRCAGRRYDRVARGDNYPGARFR